MNTGSKNNIPFVALFGPTGVGKTDLIRELFRDRFEIISADSMQVYRGMDVGTAKPDRGLRESIPHHLIDILEPDQQWNAGHFVREAERLLGEIRERGRMPLVSGGTAFYIRSLLYGLPEAPPGDPGIREEIRVERERRGLGAMFARLGEVDPVTAGRIEPRDEYRILRALEVFRTTGRPLSSYRVPDRPRTDLDPLLLDLHREREDLAHRIDLRVEEMFRDGLVDEVGRLIAAGYREQDPGMRGIGYREFFLMQKVGCMGYAEVAELMKRNSRQYAKRQRTFFRSIPGTVRIEPEATESVRMLVEPFLAAHGLG